MKTCRFLLVHEHMPSADTARFEQRFEDQHFCCKIAVLVKQIC